MKKIIMTGSGVLLACLLQAGCGVSQDPPPCAENGQLVVVCGVQAAEDLEPLADGKHLLVAQMSGGAGSSPSGIAEFNLQTDRLRALVPRIEPLPGWGDAACRPNPAPIATHGMHLSRRADSTWQLIVVNHGGRESTEFYQVVDSVGGGHQLIWRGCVVNPEGLAFNDVVAMPEGGFVATMYMELPPRGIDFMLSGNVTGYLMRWTPQAGFRKLPGSEGAVPNGVQFGRNGNEVFYSNFGGKQVVRYDLLSERVTGTVAVSFLPDNISLTPQGMLLVTGTPDVAGVRDCSARRAASCPLEFIVAAVDPASLSVRHIVEGPPGVIGGGASVTVRIGDMLYIGAYAGDRLVKTKVPATL